MTKKLLSMREAAEILNTSPSRVKEWSRRSENPLPSVVMGPSGRFRKIVADEIPAWLAREADRTQTKSARRR